MTTKAHKDAGPARRGVILILVLGVLGLMAVIGVTFATFTGQARIAGRSFAQSKLQPQSDELIDFALGQLICDTSDVRSAIRGHSLARDMYGNDARRNGSIASRINGSWMPPANDALFYVTQVDPGAGADRYYLTTNIAQNDSDYYGYNFLHWSVRVTLNPGATSPLPFSLPTATGLIPQTFEIVDDNGFNPSSSLARVFEVVIRSSDAAAELINATPFDPTPANPSDTPPGAYPSGFHTQTPAVVFRDTANQGKNLKDAFRFTLDGRRLHAFNGPGLGGGVDLSTFPPASPPDARYGNFRYNGSSPDLVGMDEDYDACDLENWFLAIQSADGQVVIPSFHRPAVVRYDPAGLGGSVVNDWQGLLPESRARIIRPRAVEGHDAATFPDLIPDAVTGAIKYDVDNDGDGATDSVWVDLGYPARRNAQGVLYKPLFAFMVIGLNGRIPLNTAGNLAGRDATTDVADSTHASHLGTSVSEIDPTYALENSYSDPNQDDAGVDVRLTQLRNLLAGTRPHANPFNPDTTGQINGDVNSVRIDGSSYYYMPNGIADAFDLDETGSSWVAPNAVRRWSPAVPGRWGEPESVVGGQNLASLQPTYNNEVRPGYSITAAQMYTGAAPKDAADDNYNSFDVWPSLVDGKSGEIGDKDFLDPAGAYWLPVERMRRFVTPIDINGTGRVRRWRGAGNDHGADQWGRVAYAGYFRPPGLPGQIAPAVAQDNEVTFPWTSGQDYPGRMVTAANVNAGLAHANNVLHGFEAARFPSLPGSPFRNGGAPINVPGPGVPTTLPTHNNMVNSSPATRSDALNEADELNLYSPNLELDAPFAHADLEWLYRYHDVDGRSLTSRLKHLAPISFTNNDDGLRRRRLFAVESWDLNNYSWTTDNPRGAFSENHNFGPGQNASATVLGAYAPALASGDKKINLNMPFPASNNPREAIRQKWINDAYQMMKLVLPPRAIDTPEELAQLGQYLVNVVDFRDPDCTMTYWVNPDVVVVPSSTATVAPTLALGTLGPLSLEHFGMEYNPIAINEILAYSYNRKNAGDAAGRYTGRFYMELVNTLTVPETQGTEAIPTNASMINLSGFNPAVTNPYDGACWDLIFTSDDANSRPDPFTGQVPPGATVYSITPLGTNSFTPATDAVLNPLARDHGTTLNEWFTGTGTNKYLAVLGNTYPGGATEADHESSPVQANLSPNASGFWLAPAFDPVNIDATPTGTLNGGVRPKTITGAAGPTTYPGKITETDVGAGNAKYFWACLRRPANPLEAVSATNPMVVVDSMRFPIINAGAKATTASTPPDPMNPNRVDNVTERATNTIFSYQRLQPYRGGHAVPVQGVTPGIDTRYGYTEQIAAPVTASSNKPQYGKGGSDPTTTQISGSLGPDLTADPIYHTLGTANDGSITRTAPLSVLEHWDYFPFLDRDFANVHELTLVPGCAPGLFTKQFAEFAPTRDAGTQENERSFLAAATAVLATTRTNLARPAVPAAAASTEVSNTFLWRGNTNPVEPHTFPYLVDKFYYTAPGYAAGTQWDGTAYDGVKDLDEGTVAPFVKRVGGFASDGWHRMFEFFEVPSTMAGAIGPVSQGSNFDWARQDVKPGLLNLNLIIDEEVFLSLLGQQSMSGGAAFVQKIMNPYQVYVFDPSLLSSVFTGGTWNGPLAAGHAPNPLVVTATLSDGSPAFAQTMSNLGISGTDPLGIVGSHNSKAAFNQFLWARHGGSGFLFGFGDGVAGQNYLAQLPTPNPHAPVYGAGTLMPLPAERPFRSASFPDIDYTVMRPAALPPTQYTDPQMMITAAAGYAGDPGIRNHWRYPGHPTATIPISNATGLVLPPAVPIRRLFQIRDGYTGSWASNAGVHGNPYINNTTPATTDGTGPITATGALPPVKTGASTYVDYTRRVVDLVMPPGLATPFDNPELGNKFGATAPDLTQHPYFRSEMMQRVMNLTTVRTHQFAVWITVGFFEVKQEGDISMFNDPAYVSGAFDILGPEIGAATAQNKRYRSFVVVDRLKLMGFDTDTVGAFRSAVMYRRTVE